MPYTVSLISGANGMLRYTARHLLKCVIKYRGRMAESVSETHWLRWAPLVIVLQLLLMHFVSSVGFLLLREKPVELIRRAKLSVSLTSRLHI